MEGITSSFENFDKKDEELLTMSLSTGPRSPIQTPSASSSLSCLLSTPSLSPQKPLPQPIFSVLTLPPPPPPPPPPSHPYITLPSNLPTSFQKVTGPSRLSRTRRSLTQILQQGKSEAIPAPYPWATTRRAMVHSLEYLLNNGMSNIVGQVQCKRCEQLYEIEYDLQQKFMEVASFISKNKCSMHDRAPAIWMNPSLPNCKFCEQNNCVRPVITKKKSINWLFLLLGQMLGCCKLAQLKYFCKHTKNHRTGAKDRVLYLTYLGLCKQIDPNGPFNI